MVDMVNDQRPARLDNLAVHLNIEPSALADAGVSSGIEGVFALDGIPFVLI